MKRNDTRLTAIWRNIALVTAAISIGVIGFTFHRPSTPPEEPRPAASISGRALVISDRTKADLSKLVSDNVLIAGVSTVQIDLRKNHRQTVWFNTDHASLQMAWENKEQISVPTFSSGDNARFNDRVASIINGNFDCRKFEETIDFVFFPEVNKHAPWLCGISIPPGFDESGDFVGFINLYITRKPTDQDMKRLGREATQLSAEIYKRDVALK